MNHENDLQKIKETQKTHPEVGDIKRDVMFTSKYLSIDFWVDIFMIEIMPN